MPSQAKPKQKSISMTEFRRQPGEYLLDVRRDRMTITLLKAGKAVARIVPVEDSTEDVK